MKKTPSKDASENQFSERLSDLLKRFESLDHAADVAGVSKATVYAWRNGTARVPFDAISRLCHHCGASLDWLAGGDWHPKNGSDHTTGEADTLKFETFMEIWESVEKVSTDYTNRTHKACSLELKKAIILSICNIIRQYPQTDKGDLVMTIYGLLIAA